MSLGDEASLSSVETIELGSDDQDETGVTKNKVAMPTTEDVIIALDALIKYHGTSCKGMNANGSCQCVKKTIDEHGKDALTAGLQSFFQSCIDITNPGQRNQKENLLSFIIKHTRVVTHSMDRGKSNHKRDIYMVMNLENDGGKIMICVTSISVMMAGLPVELDKVGDVWNKVFCLGWKISLGMSYKKMTRTIFYIPVLKKVEEYNKEVRERRSCPLKARKDSLLVSQQHKWIQLFDEITKALQESDDNNLADQPVKLEIINFRKKQNRSYTLTQKFSKHHLSQILICHEALTMRKDEEKPEKLKNDALYSMTTSLNRILDNVSGVVVTMHQDVTDMWEEYAEHLRNNGAYQRDITRVRNTGETRKSKQSYNIQYQVYDGVDIRTILGSEDSDCKLWAANKINQQELFHRAIKYATKKCYEKKKGEPISSDKDFAISYRFSRLWNPGSSYAFPEHYQDAHRDFAKTTDDWRERGYLAFFPMTRAGMFLQVWTDPGLHKSVEGHILFIPQGQMLVLPGNTVHGGALMSEPNGNVRGHLYIYPNATNETGPTNENWDANLEAKTEEEMEEKYKHNNYLGVWDTMFLPRNLRLYRDKFRGDMASETETEKTKLSSKKAGIDRNIEETRMAKSQFKMKRKENKREYPWLRCLFGDEYDREGRVIDQENYAKNRRKSHPLSKPSNQPKYTQMDNNFWNKYSYYKLDCTASPVKNTRARNAKKPRIANLE